MIETPGYAPPTTFRTDVAAGLAALVAAYRTANPGRIYSHWDARPAQFTETPLTFLGSYDETITHSGQVRTRTMTVEFVLVDHLADNQETAGRVNPLVDALIDWLTANPHLGEYGWVAQAVGVVGLDVEPADGKAGSWHYEIIRVQASVQEGRS